MRGYKRPLGNKMCPLPCGCGHLLSRLVHFMFEMLLATGQLVGAVARMSRHKAVFRGDGDPLC